jgi:malate dehydrogenase (oxaloacetate-decarboxylating)
MGIAQLLREALRRTGVSGDGLFRAVALVDLHGLLVDEAALVEPYQRELAWPVALAAKEGLGAEGARALEDVVRAVRPTVLIAATGQPGALTHAAVQAMAGNVERPVILPLSNPTSKSEATPEDLLSWTDGRALVAAGSPFPPVERGGRRFSVAQANNAFIFPAIGLACVLGDVREVTPALFMAAAEALSQEVSDAELHEGRLLPRVRDLRRVTARLAAAVLREARDAGVGRAFEDHEIAPAVAAAMWEPRYALLVPADDRRARR